MIKRTIIFIFTLSTLIAQAQLTPSDAAKSMLRGINIGNTMEATPGTYSWGNPAISKRAFDDYKNAGFTAIRIPITWDQHTLHQAPYTVDKAWMDEVEDVVDRGLSKGLLIIINAHHDGWIKDSYTASNVTRFDSIWSQIATRFKDKSDSLLFEIINEPNPMTLTNINALNKRTLANIRKTNPTRIVVFSGDKWSGPSELVHTAVPDVADKYLIGYYHSYDPYPFGLVGTGTYGSVNDINATRNIFKSVTDWGVQKGMPVLLGEYGYMKKCDYNSRMCAYATVVDFSIQYGVPSFAWDDGGDFPIYNRSNGSFNEIKDILIYTYPVSPNKLKISNTAEKYVKVQWTNRTSENDSIIVERRINNGGFAKFATISPAASEFVDSLVIQGKSHYYRLRSNLKDSIELQSYPIMIYVLPSTREPYFGKAVNIPGWVQAENYDKGGEGVGYHDADAINQGGSNYRVGDGVDIEEQPTKNYHVGNVAAGEWLEYSINVPQSGTYDINARVATGNDGGGQFRLQFSNGGSVTLTTLATSSMNDYLYVRGSIQLTEGEQVLRLSILQIPEFNIDYIEFLKATGSNDIALNLTSVYPNPVKDKLEIQTTNKISDISLHDCIGRNMQQLINVEGKSVDMSRLKNGVYIFSCRIDDKFWVEKILKN